MQQRKCLHLASLLHVPIPEPPAPHAAPEHTLQPLQAVSVAPPLASLACAEEGEVVACLQIAARLFLAHTCPADSQLRLATLHRCSVELFY